MSPQQVSSADVDEFVRLLQELEREASALLVQLEGSGREEGAETVRAVAADLARQARDGRLPGSPGALPLSRPFGEWSYGSAARPVWQRIDAVDDFWLDRLGRGDFEVVP
jgi:hypothetical protein